jgi:hypothetical protein
MTDTTREEELKRVPLRKRRRPLPNGVRSISIDELDRLGVDNDGRLYWEDKPVEVSRKLTRWQTLGAFVVGLFIVLGAIGTIAQAWAVYHDWACLNGWPALMCAVP